MNTKVIIRVLLGVAVVFMAFICVKSVVTPIQFEEARVQREVKVINNLVSLRTAEAQFRLDKGYFTADLDSLIDYLKTAPKKEVFKVGSLSEKQLEDGLTETKAAKILERARLKAQRKMKFQGTDSLDLLYNYIWAEDREVKSNGLQVVTHRLKSLLKHTDFKFSAANLQFFEITIHFYPPIFSPANLQTSDKGQTNIEKARKVPLPEAQEAGKRGYDSFAHRRRDFIISNLSRNPRLYSRTQRTEVPYAR